MFSGSWYLFCRFYSACVNNLDVINNNSIGPKGFGYEPNIDGASFCNSHMTLSDHMPPSLCEPMHEIVTPKALE